MIIFVCPPSQNRWFRLWLSHRNFDTREIDSGEVSVQSCGFIQYSYLLLDIPWTCHSVVCVAAVPQQPIGCVVSYRKCETQKQQLAMADIPLISGRGAWAVGCSCCTLA
jgi:hypothetical protein